MRMFLAKYRAYMIRSNWISEFGSGVVVLFAVYQILDTIDIAGPVKVGDLPEPVLRSFILEAAIVISFSLRCVAAIRIQYIPHWVFAGSWFLCAIVGAVYFYFDYGHLAVFIDLRRIDILSNWMWMFIVFSGVRFFITAATAYALSLDEFDTYRR